MKKSLQIFALLFCIIISAQAPEKFSYQAIIRNASNALITNATVGVKISILKTSNAGTVVYAESQTPTTNINGLISVQIGAGTVISGTIAGINWSNDSYYIKTETDPAGGTNYTIAGATQLLSVPYALYAKNSGGGSGLTLPYSGTSATPTTTAFSVVNSAATLNSAGNFENSSTANTAPALRGKNVAINGFGVGIEGRANSTQNGNLSVGVRGIVEGTGSAGAGVYGSSLNAIGIYGTTDKGIGVYGYTDGTGNAGTFTTDGTGKALRVNGAIQLSFINEGAGKVLTSDAQGNATWQDGVTPFVQISSLGGSSQVITGYTEINSWQNLEEAGGSNYNSTTGLYTIPVAGYYAISAHISFQSSNTRAGNQASVSIYVDNTLIKTGYSDMAVSGKFYSDPSISVVKFLNVGQKVKIAASQDGGTNNLFRDASTFSIELRHK